MTDKHERHGRHILEQARVPCWSSFHWIGGEFEDERLYYKRINVNCIVCRLWYGWKRSYLRGGMEREGHSIKVGRIQARHLNAK